MADMTSSQYINSERREYSLYVLSSRSIPHVADGLKAAARRVLWVARDGHKTKSATLAGAAIPLHPHAPPESTINTLAAPYGNNICLLDGEGAFGTLIKPTAYGAARYTSVRVSAFTKDVMFKDIEIVPMVDNFDNSQKEPKHFLPLIPMVLVNPQEGIAVGFACNIISRDIKDIINHQIDYLSRGKIPKTEAIPYFGPLDQRSVDHIVDANGKIKWLFRGTYERNSATELTITALPYGLSHDKVIGKLERLIDGGTLLNIEDNSRDKYKIKLKFKKRVLSSMDDDQIIKMIGLDSSQTENLNVIDFDGQRVWGSAYCDTIVKYCDWRLSWYITRYQRLADLIQIDIQKLKDVITAIEKNVGGQARKMASRSEMKEYLEAIGIVHLDYIADLPVYRFTEQEREKTQIKLDEALVTLDHYNELIASEDKRKQVYVDELIEVRNNIPKYTSNKK